MPDLHATFSTSGDLNTSASFGLPHVPKKTSDLINDSDFQTSAQVQQAISTAVAPIQESMEEVEDSVSGKLDKTGGTLTGELVAQSNQNYTTRQVRNILFLEDDPANDIGQDGDICIVIGAD